MENVIEVLEDKPTQYYSSLADAYHLKSKCLLKLQSLQEAEQAINKAIKIEEPFDTWRFPQLSTMISLKASHFQNTKDERHLLALTKYQDQIDSIILELQLKHRHYEDELNPTWP